MAIPNTKKVVCQDLWSYNMKIISYNLQILNKQVITFQKDQTALHWEWFDLRYEQLDIDDLMI